MKVLVVLCAVAACCVAKPGYYAPGGYSTSVVSYSSSIVHPSPVVAAPAPVVAAPAPIVYSAPAVVAAPAPAPIVYSAPASAPVVYSAPAPAPAPVVYAAPAPAPAPVAVAAPVVAPAPVVAAPAPVVAAPAVVPAVAAAVKTQYHSQDEHGQAAYGHSEPGQVHNAVQDAHGNKVGSFSYVAPNGNVLRTDYVADGAGYRVASNALPVAPVGLGHRVRRSLYQTPASTQPLPVYAPTVYAVAAPAPVVVRAPAPVVVRAPAPVAYAAPAVVPAAPYVPAPAPYVPAPAPVAVPGVRYATLTTVVNNPGHAVSYRVD